MDAVLALRVLRSRWWLLIAAPVLGGATAFAISTRLTPTYEATTTLLVVQRQAQGIVQLNDLQTSERLANTFSRLMTIRPVLEQAITDGQLPFTPKQLEQRITVRNPATTQLLEVSARASEADLAARTANTIASVFISSNQADLTNRPGLVSVVQRAVPPEEPIAPRTAINAAVGATFLLLATAGAVLLIDYLDDTVKSLEQAQEVTGLRALGSIAQFERGASPREQLQAVLHPRSTAAEAYRAARTALSQAMGLGRDRHLILVMSPGTAEGRTTTVANLAVVFGLAGHRVCVVDADLRRPTMHRIFGIDGHKGLAGLLLAREADLDRAIQRTVHANVSVVASGSSPPNPSELLGSARMHDVLQRIKSRFDVVLLDSPPALTVTDASVLATLVDGLLVVARAHHTRVADLRTTVEGLQRSGRPIAGVLLNGVASQDAHDAPIVGRRGRDAGDEDTRAAISERMQLAEATGGGSTDTASGRAHAPGTDATRAENSEASAVVWGPED